MAGKKDQQMKEITERLEQGVKEMFTSEMYTKYLQTMSQFHNYSFNNTLLIAMQKPDATLVAGYQAWQKKFKRQVKRGEKGIQIIAPAPIREKEQVEKFDPETHELILRPDGQPETEEVVHVIPRFRVTTVFDVSQTYGEPLPELATPELMGNVENYEIFMQAIREVSPVPIRFDGIKGESKGFYSNTNKEIVIREGMSESQTMKTAVHEVTHAKLHDRDIMEELGDKKDKMTREVEAESVAYTVCQYFGLDTSDYSFPYIAGWSSDREMKELRTSMDTVRKTAGEFIDNMTEVMQRLLREQPQHLKEDDLVLEYALPSEEGESYFVVRNMEKAELLVQLHSYHELYGENREKEIDTFLQEQGAEVIPWYDSHGLQVENPVTFYDVIYHGEKGLVADAAGYPPVIQAALLMDRAEYEEKFLSDSDKLLITRYAEKIANMDKVKALLRDFEAAAQAPDSRLTEEVRQTAQAEIDALDKGSEIGSEAGLGLPDSTERYQRVELFDVPALFSNGRVEGPLPDGIYSYDLRGSDYDPGYPLTVENHVTVNHAATVLTAVPLAMPEQGYLRLGEGLNFTGGEQSVMEYLQEMEGKDLSMEREKAESAIGEFNENLYLSGDDDRYAIYQIAGGTKGRDYRFMSMDFVTSHNMTVDAADYRYVYGGRLTEQETLDSLYEKFNINHPEGYTGYSLSMSDVVVLQKNGEAKAYYVDRLGFTDLPDFIPQRQREAEMNRKREDSQITLDTSEAEIEQHEGLWHTVDKMEIGDEIFYLMKHNEYGDSVAAVVVNADGELVAQELENGFDRGALEAIQEYLAGKGISWEPEPQEKIEEKAYPPVYRESLTYAMGHAAVDDYLDSRKLNIDCRRAVETAIRDNFDGMHLADNVVDSVLEEYGSERLSFVLACTVQHNSWDGRFSRDTKAWAEGISVPENIDRGRDMNLDYVVESHPAVLDGFIGMAREKFKEREQEVDVPMVSIARFYVVNDAYGVKAEREYQYFPTLDAALTTYAALPNHLDKQIGMESTENPPSQMSLINCRNGIEELNDIKSVSLSGKWVNPKTMEMQERAQAFLESHDTEIAYQIDDRYFRIQSGRGAYDFTFYDSGFHVIDGGSYGNADISMREAVEEIVGTFADAPHSSKKVIDVEKFMEKVEAAEKEEIEQAQAVVAAEEEPKKEFPLISDSVKPEKALNWKSRADIEETVLCYAQAQIDEMGLTDEVELLGARVYGSRTRSSLVQDGSGIDVVLSYTGSIPVSAFSNIVHGDGLEIACLPINITLISAEKTGTLEDFMEDDKSYLDWAEAHKLAEDIVTFSYYHDTYNYLDTADSRDGQIHGIVIDIAKGDISGLEDWMREVIRESRDPKEVIEAKGFMQRLIDQTDGQRYTVCETSDSYEEPFTVFDRVNGDYYQDKDGFTPLLLTELEAQEKAAEINAAFQAERETQVEPEPKISFYVAECMEYPVLGEYHNNLTLQEAADIYRQIPAERMNGIKGIGFRLEDGSMYDGEIGLMSMGVIDKEFVNSIPHYKESPLVQKAIADLETIMEREKGMESRMEPDKNGQEQAQETKDRPVSGNAHETAAEPEKPQKTTPETDRSDGNGGGRKQSVLQALRERQAKLKAQENQKPEKEPKAHKKGEQEL